MIQDTSHPPHHVAIIMDGNGRWARRKGLPRTSGHRQGLKRVKEIVKAAAQENIKFLTLFAFSSENWNRPQREINTIMLMLCRFLDTEVREMNRNNIRFSVIGREHPLSLTVRKKIQEAEELTRKNTGLTVILAFNYGSRQEIVDAAKKFALEAVKDKVSVSRLDPESFSRYLYTADIPDPDMLIRTSGELRISNFLLWQISYAELYFTQKCWPDFSAQEFKLALLEFQKRQRRFGG